MIDLEKYKDYVQSETPNRKLIADIIQERRGIRSAASYAADIGLNPTRISRIVNRNYSNALDMNILCKLADGDEKYFERLLAANGMLSPEEQARKSMRSDMTARMSVFSEMENKANTIFVSELLSRGLILKQITPALDVESRVAANILFDSAYVVTDKDGSSIKWYFEYLVPVNIMNRSNESVHFDRARVVKTFRNRAHILLIDAWEPERMKNCKFSFVFFEERSMAVFEELIVKEKLNNRFSLILIDLDASKVKKEVVLKGDDDMNVFERDAINAKQKDSFMDELDDENMDE